MTKVAAACFLSHSLRFSYAFSLNAYTYYLFGDVISRIESYY